MPLDEEESKEKRKVWFREARHNEEVKGAPLDNLKNKDDWRKIKERMKTVSVALVLCLNVGVDPPDVKKPLRCARKEAWVEPGTLNPQRSAQKISQSLQKIYEKLQPRARYKSAIDPTVDCVRKLCTSMRRNAKDERVLFHFNGHGVPKPTDAGEIWVFNKNITQYIPLSLYDLQSWMGVPSVYLWDCNSAGTIVNMFMQFAEDHSMRWMEEYQTMQQQQPHHPSPGPSGEGCSAGGAGVDPTQSQQIPADRGNDLASNASTSSHSLPSYKNCIQLGACAVGEILPFHNPDLPADLFTCCLITPIQTSILCHMLKLGVKNRFPANIIDDIPGVLTDRRTLLGELNWIFTAITDTIAWSCLPVETFQKLFRQDLLIASLFRSFLLAQRIMLENGCHVVSTPELPSVHNHSLWEYWDYVLDMTITNMYNLLKPKPNIIQFTRNNCFVATPSLRHNLLIELNALAESEYIYSWFFIDQLQAFEIWLKFSVDKQKPPEQLPVVLQVLLSQIHRVRALELLARFVDIGPWAVVSALSVGIFPYVLKLLQCGTKELRPALAFIWAKILAVDPICQHELVKDNGYFYFLQVLNDPAVSPKMKIVAAFVMATIIYNNYRPAQEKLVQSDYVSLCIELLSNREVIQCRMLCLWLLIGLGRLWSECDKARWQAIRNVAYDKAIEFLDDEMPEVRASAVYALGCFVHNTSRNNEHAIAVENEVCDKLCDKCIYDGSILVRSELAAAIQWFIIDFQSKFASICIDLERKVEVALQKPMTSTIIGNGTIHAGAGVEIQKALAAMTRGWSPSAESGFVNGTSGSGVTTSGPNSGRNSALGNSGPTRSQSIYSTFPRSTSTVLYPSGRQRTSPVRKGSLLARSDGATLLPAIPPLDSANVFKYRIVSHITELEKKPIIGPFERIWLCVLRLGLDPFEDVAKMGERIIQYVFDLSTKIKDARSKALEIKHRTPTPVGARQTQSLSVNGPERSGHQQQQQQTGSLEQSSQSNPTAVKFLVGSPSVPSTSAFVSSTLMPGDKTHSSNGADKRTSSGGEEAITANSSTSESSTKNVPMKTANGHRQQQLSLQTEQQPQQQQLPPMDNAKRRLLMDPFIHQSLYTPKRNIFGTQSGAYSQVNNDISEALLSEQAATVATEGLVRTTFVDWCGKIWTEPIYQTIYDERCTSTRNSLVNSNTPYTVELPTDWAIHIHDGIKQRAKKETQLLRAKQARCELQCMKLKLNKPATSMAWSFLRPYVYIGDGERVRIYSYPTGEALPQQQQSSSSTHLPPQQPTPPPPSRLCGEWQIGGESFLLDSVSELMVANGLTHELLMTGSRNGLLKIWDPQYNEHSYEIEGKKPKLITATYLLNDLQRQDRDKGNRTLYHWDQEEGRLICSGNVRVCRIWDAWAEKGVYDVALRHSKGSVVRVDSDLYCNLVSCGFSDGTLAVFDTRLPSHECEIMRVRDSNAPVIGMGLLRERQRLLVGTSDGFVKLWEPRMFQEPISEFNVANISLQSAQHTSNDSRILHQMEVQKNGQLAACAMADSSVYLFDIDGRGGVLSRMRFPRGGTNSIFYSPSTAIGNLASLIRQTTRRRSSSGGSGGGDDHLLPSSTMSGSSHPNSHQTAPTALRFHKYRILLGLSTGEGQFRAFSMPNLESTK